METHNMLLSLSNISKTYLSSYGAATRKVLSDINLSMRQGERIAIVGPSGSGKTTLLNIIGTIDTPDNGSYTLMGRNVLSMNQKQTLALRNQQVGFVFQQHHLLPQCTLWENVLIPTIPQNTKGNKNYEYAESLLNEVGLWDVRNQKPAELSGGECQRAAVVRALINTPNLLLADEPTGSLDQENASQLTQLLINLNGSKSIAMIVVTHSLELARSIGRVYELRDGRLEEVETNR